MVVNLARAALAAVLGTILFDLVGFLLTRKFWDIPALLGSKLVADHALLAGPAAHYANGVLLGIIYAGLEPSLWGNRWARVFTFITAETVFGVWLFMLPLLGAGFMGPQNGACRPACNTAEALGLCSATRSAKPVTEATSLGAPPLCWAWIHLGQQESELTIDRDLYVALRRT